MISKMFGVFLSRRLLLDALARVGTEAAGLVLKECITGGKVTKELHRIVFGIGWVRGLNLAYVKQVMVSANQISCRKHVFLIIFFHNFAGNLSTPNCCR